jgi:AcrR family transcriptional regulator
MEKRNLREERKRHRQEENKDSILQAAEKVFVQKGYSLSTVDDIAVEAQFSKATLYRYFKSKSDIFLEIIYGSFEESYQEIKKIQEKSLSAEEKLRELIGYIFSYYHEKKNLARILFVEKAAMEKITSTKLEFPVAHGPVHPDIPPRFLSKMRQISDLICAIIEEGVESGEFRDLDVQDAGVVLGSLIRGIHFRGPLHDREYSMQEATDLLHSFFLNGIKRQKKVRKGD